MNKTYSEYLNYIKYMLGAVGFNKDSLEILNDDLTTYIKLAFSEILPYISARDRITFPWTNGFNGAIDFNSFNIRAKSVTSVRRGNPQGYLNGGISLTGGWSSYTVTINGAYPNVPLYTAGGSLYSYCNADPSADPWSIEKLMLKGINETAGDGHFLFDYGKQLLFINFNTATPSSTTVDFIPEFRTAEDIYDDYWVMLLQKKSLAMVKMALSHLRGKFSSVEGAPFQLDYQRLYTEGETDNQRIQEELEENLLNYRFD